MDKIIAPLGRRLDETHPMVDARLKDGSRLNAILPPLAINGPILSIRRFNPSQGLGFTQLIHQQSLSHAMAELCLMYVNQRANILISGGTGSGKTTFLNVLASHIHHQERLITIEDAAELRIHHPHIVSLETRPANTEGGGEITGEQLLKNALRMRPNRIIFGELRAKEAWDLMQAMNTGHPGSMTTIHANSAEHALIRLEQLITNHQEHSLANLSAQLKQTIDVIIHLERDSLGQRRIVSIHELHPKKYSPLVCLYSYDGQAFTATSLLSKYRQAAQHIFL
uniref:CpaF family protein n=1 Tax=Ferrovum sp. JA12 TaxID=1356299 RepID=UPI001EFB4C1A|nr:ATPase, T2SS/T4P/T4SS family [Ferrovum sp. JA12]